ncbi:MAG: M28 family peptidase [Euryarchaeota archaeon]|nr:M28 family peptidase [Euryarchaeota archaeon]
MPRALLAVLVLLGVALSGCLRNDPADGTLTPTTPGAEADSCTNVPAPTWSQQDAALRGANAFDYVIGLICDHSGGAPKERARVPGTPQQVQGAAYLHGELKEAGWNAQFQNFTGAQYDTIMQARGGSHAQWWRDCTAADQVRMRGLPFSNVEARFGSGSRIVLLMAHWDSKRFADGDSDAKRRTEPVLGANDGASGVGLLLELARVLAKEPASTTWQYRILLTDGEDGFEDCHPLAGSTYYAEGLSAAERTLFQAILLLDMVGDEDAGFYRGCGSDTALGDRLWTVAARLDVRQFKNTTGCNGITDDHTPFEDRSMKSVDVIDYHFGEGFPSYWHTTGDTPDKISPDMLGAVGRVVQQTLKELPIAP